MIMRIFILGPRLFVGFIRDQRVLGWIKTTIGTINVKKKKIPILK